MTEEKLRLHITPFSNTLAQSLLSTYSSIATTSVSLHTLETLPGHSYGFIELSAVEGEMLKRKLHGSILKGKKLQIEHARPQKHGLEPENNKNNNRDSSSVAVKESRPLKGTRAPGSEMQGHELTPERKIKRGWTEPDKESRLRSSSFCASRPTASKYTNRAECIFRVQLPPNKETITRNQKTQGKKGKKITTVHEFENSIAQPSFIRREPHTGDIGVAVEYVDGKGWVDKDGRLVEEESKSQLRKRSRIDDGQLSHKAADGNRDQTENKSVIVSGDGILFDDETIEQEAADEESPLSGKSQSASDSESEPQEKLEQIPKAESADVNNASEATPTANLPVHPLETLFKRPSQPASRTKRKRSLEIKTTFNFFESSEDQSILQTPFTTRDLQLRGLRSAAPTPDTALPTRRFFADSVSPSGKTGIDDEELVEGPSDSSLPFGKSPQKEGPKAETDFAKWFWEHRGENNRAWKRRRREAMKEKRQKGNRQEGHRVG